MVVLLVVIEEQYSTNGVMLVVIEAQRGKHDGAVYGDLQQGISGFGGGN